MVLLIVLVQHIGGFGIAYVAPSNQEGGRWWEMGGFGRGWGAPQIPPLRYAPVGMTKVGAVRSFEFVGWDGEQLVSHAVAGGVFKMDNLR